ncbi:ENTH domain-containing protein [Penicillium capsulatum]|nr:ENTH domain-containing protein [Penicillium capsulatum]
MDLSSLKEQVSNLTVYDLKAGVRKMQNAVMNYTEMEAKVRKPVLACDNDNNNPKPSISSSPIQDIRQLLNEIMPLIYKRFTDKAAEEWRQIYKSLQLLEFLVKNGSERVVDDARSHMSLLRMLRQFHYIDMNGKDQGINVRNRSSELVKLLGDVDQIRTERKKARANRNKFSGFEGGMNVGSGMGSSSRYGGFGSDSMGYGGYSGGVYGDGGGFGGATSDFQDTGRRGNRFEEYDEYDEGDISPPRARDPPVTSSKQAPKKPEPEPVADLFDFGDDEPTTTTTSSTAAGKQPASSGLNMLDPTPADDDDFDDFHQFAIAPPASTASTTSNTQFAAPKPVSASQGNNINGLVGFTSATPTPSGSSVASPVSAPIQQQQQGPKPTGFQAATPNYFTSVSTNSPQPLSSHSSKPSITSPTAASAATNKPAAAKQSGDAFGSLWSSASASAGITKSNANANKGPNLASMAKEKASAGIWGAPASSLSTGTGSPAASMGGQQQQQQKQGGSAFDDLLG